MSIADKFIAVMAEINRMDADMADDAPERHAVRRLKAAAAAHIEAAINAAYADIDACEFMRKAINEARPNA